MFSALGAKVDPSVVFAMPPGMTLPSSCSACAFASQINVSLCCSGSKMHQMASAEASLSAARSVPTSISTPADTAVSVFCPSVLFSKMLHKTPIPTISVLCTYAYI